MSRVLDLDKQLPAVPASRLLGAVVYGGALPAGLPQVCLSVPLPGLPEGSEPFVWLADGPFTEGECAGLKYRHNADFLFGSICLSEAACTPTDARSAFQQISEQAYSALFATLQQTGFTSLLRCWNYLPRINVDGGGLERYRQFNIGRQDAFMAAGQAWLEGSPSACALGTAGGDLLLYFLAGKSPAALIENPRQVSAYHYPQQYGPRSPTFSRASLLRLADEEVLFISGTASIVGHESRHPGDVRAQTRETLNNLEVLVGQANLQATLGRFSLHELNMKVYIRHAADQAAVAAELAEQLGPGLNTSYLQADICRAELLVEIEAFAFLDRSRA